MEVRESAVVSLACLQCVWGLIWELNHSFRFVTLQHIIDYHSWMWPECFILVSVPQILTSTQPRTAFYLVTLQRFFVNFQTMVNYGVWLLYYKVSVCILEWSRRWNAVMEWTTRQSKEKTSRASFQFLMLFLRSCGHFVVWAAWSDWILAPENLGDDASSCDGGELDRSLDALAYTKKVN